MYNVEKGKAQLITPKKSKIIGGSRFLLTGFKLKSDEVLRSRIKHSLLSARRHFNEGIKSRAKRNEIKRSNSALVLENHLDGSPISNTKERLKKREIDIHKKSSSKSENKPNHKECEQKELVVELNLQNHNAKNNEDHIKDTQSHAISDKENLKEKVKEEKRLSITHCRPLDIQHKADNQVPEEIYKAINSIIPKRRLKAKRYSRFLTKSKKEYTGLSRNRITASTPRLKTCNNVSIQVAGENVTLEDAHIVWDNYVNEALNSTKNEKDNLLHDKVFSNKDCNTPNKESMKRTRITLNDTSQKGINIEPTCNTIKHTVKLDSKKPDTPNFGEKKKSFNFTFY